jgi:hypothetical protein
LALHDLRGAFRRHPFVELPLRHDPTRRHRVDADAKLAVVARQRAREAQHRGFCRRVAGHPALTNHPSDRAQIDDDSVPGRFHVGQHGLCAKKLMLEIDRDPAVPNLFGDRFGGVPLVIGRVIDQYLNGTELALDGRNTGLQGRHIGEVPMCKADPCAALRQFFQQCTRRLDRYVDEADSSLLLREFTHDGLAYS